MRKPLTDGKERSISNQMPCHMAVPLNNVKNEVQLKIFHGETKSSDERSWETKVENISNIAFQITW